MKLNRYLVFKGVLFFVLVSQLAFTRVYAENGIINDEDTIGSMAAERGALWRSHELEVCWENPGSWDLERKWVEETIRDTWGKYSGLNFTGWKKCQSSTGDLRVYIGETWPRVLDFGSRLKGVKNGVKLNFTFNMPEFSGCRSRKEECIKRIAVHEFGHALGLHHEQNRSDRPDNICVREKYQGNVPDELLVTRYDKFSIMNYCSPSAYNEKYPILSEGDKEGIAKLYPKNKLRTNFKLYSTSLNECKQCSDNCYIPEGPPIKEICPAMNGYSVNIVGENNNELEFRLTRNDKLLINDNSYSNHIKVFSNPARDIPV